MVAHMSTLKTAPLAEQSTILADSQFVKMVSASWDPEPVIFASNAPPKKVALVFHPVVIIYALTTLAALSVSEETELVTITSARSLPTATAFNTAEREASDLLEPFLSVELTLESIPSLIN